VARVDKDLQPPITIGGAEVRAGTRVTIDLPTAHLYTHTEMTMPVHVVHGRRSGPRLFVCAAIHGDEINGVEVIRRLLRLKLLGEVKGTLIAIPIVNVYGFINHTRYLPDRRDLNRSFPGSRSGSLAARVANLFMEEIVANCTHGIDIHTGSNHRFNMPQIRAALDDDETVRLAKSFGAPLVIDSRLRDGSLREAADERAIPLLLYESGESNRFYEPFVKLGLRGIVRVMREIGMLKKEKTSKRTVEPLFADTTTWVRAPMSGMMEAPASVGGTVKKGGVLCKVVDPLGEKREPITSPVTGVIIARRMLPLFYEGDALFHITATPTDEHEAYEAALTAMDFETTDNGAF